MNVIAFKHFDFDDAHAIALWAFRNGHTLTICNPAFGVNDSWLAAMDMLIILGGPMSVYEEEKYSWLAEEKRFIRQAIRKKKKILGICLGAQMLAELLGGRVYRHACKEIGWHSVRLTEERHPWLSDFPEQFHSFQWHGDTFDLPQGARWLAQSTACANQAFSHGEDDRIVGLQFHLETTPACMDTMLELWSNELGNERYIHTAEQIRIESYRSQESYRLLHLLLDRTAAS